MDRSIVRIPAYIAFGFAAFLVALVLTFPDQRLKEIATVQIESQLGSSYDVKIGDLDLWWLTGIELEDVELVERVVATDQEGGDSAEDDGREDEEVREAGGAPENEPFRLEIPRIAGGFSPIASILNFAPTADFLIDLGGGEITGNYIHGSDQRAVELDIDEIDLGKTAVLDGALGVPVLGTLDGEATIEFDGKRPLVTGGQIKLDGSQLTIDKATLRTDKLGPMAFIDVPQTSFGKLTARLNIEKPEKSRTPKIDFEEFRFHDGRDVRGQVWGDIDLGRNAATSRAKLRMRFQIDDKFVRKNDLSSVLRMKWFREGKNQEWYGFMLWGRLNNPRFKGAPTAAQGPQEDKKEEQAAAKDG